jgi:hypothetical protein
MSRGIGTSQLYSLISDLIIISCDSNSLISIESRGYDRLSRYERLASEMFQGFIVLRGELGFAAWELIRGYGPNDKVRCRPP